MELRDRRGGLPAVLLALLPLLPSWWFAAAKPWLPMSVDDDAAVIEMAERRALHGTQATGAYSRFGFAHPGPVQLYLMAPVYTATGQRSAGLALAALVVSTLFTAGAAYAAARLLGPRRGLAVAAALALLVARMGPAWPAHAWAPHAVILPLAFFVLAALGFAREGGGWLPALAFAGTYLVQTHLGTAPVVTLVFLAAAVLAVRSGRKVLTTKSVLLSFAILAALWTPPVLEEVRGTAAHPGNLTLLVRFFRSHGASHTFPEVVGPLAHEIGSLPVALAGAIVPGTSDRRDVGAGAFFLLLVALLPLALVAARRRRDDDAAALSWLALAGLVASWLAGLRIVGDSFDYLFTPASAVGFAGWTALALAAARPFEERGRSRAVLAACVAVAVLAAVANARGLVQQQPMPVETKPAVKALTPLLEAHLATTRTRKPLVRISDGEPWIHAAGVLLELERDGIPFSVEEDWTVMFGRNRRPKGDEDGVVWFSEVPPPGATALGAFGKTGLWAMPPGAR